MPSLLFKDGILKTSFPSKDHLLYNRLFVFASEYIHRSLHCQNKTEIDNFFSFCRFINLTPMELNGIFMNGLMYRYISNIKSIFFHYKFNQVLHSHRFSLLLPNENNSNWIVIINIFAFANFINNNYWNQNLNNITNMKKFRKN